MRLHEAALRAEIRKAVDGGTHRFIVSASSPDRVNDTIDPAAYEPWAGKSVIALWQHDSDKPFGTWKDLQKRGNKLVGDLIIASTNLGAMVSALLDDGVPLGASIGFRGKGEANKIGGIHFKEIDLLEISIVSVGAHPAAVEIAKNYGVTLPALESARAVSGATATTIAKARCVVAKLNLKLRAQR